MRKKSEREEKVKREHRKYVVICGVNIVNKSKMDLYIMQYCVNIASDSVSKLKSYHDLLRISSVQIYVK
ncbi:Hypothetical predicted protein [Octopus vulgaris]|uniref:Uncharacterized protein n=1 Tax=Octopus vulgaris TaxID=6645 RepID=A0AA36AXS0_OCTVU|nr:Hypothetical predicted protein [Octopus vulgaris]